MKAKALEAIGDSDLREIVQIEAALRANDRLKYYFSLLQLALSHADYPEQATTTLANERIACSIDDMDLDSVVGAARREADRYYVPSCAKVIERIRDDVRTMAVPVLASSVRDGYADRLSCRLAELPAADADIIDGAAVATMTSAGSQSGPLARGSDSLHRLVMDLHKIVNGLQAALSEDTLDGAAVYHLGDGDGELVGAFMAGLNRTAKLKFGHPGLGTTATRTGEQLVIQNDIGTTDAHVIVIHVQGLSVSITYSDIHLERLQFFTALFERYRVKWSSEQSRQPPSLGEQFYLTIGRFDALDEDECRQFLESLGSRIVFLIDWNRARKELRSFLRAKHRIEVLRWAADADIGHRGFLELGGARAINRAIETTAGSAIHFGDRLCDVLGDDATLAFVKFVFAHATAGLLAHDSTSLIRDRIRAELKLHCANEQRRLAQVAADHADLTFEIASLVREGILAATIAEGDTAKRSARASRFEHDADELVIAAREIARRRPDHAAFARLLEAADDAADELEDVTFLLGLISESAPNGPLEALRSLAEVVLEATQEWVKATHLGASNEQDDADAFLTAIDRVGALEHRADDAERELTRAAIGHATDFRQLHLYSTMGAALEEAADALKYASLLLRDRVLGEPSGA
jgi:uncharacterized protein Yka (UPF0111/DUF47 family)